MTEDMEIPMLADVKNFVSFFILLPPVSNLILPLSASVHRLTANRSTD